MRQGKIAPGAKDAGMEGLVDDFKGTNLNDKKGFQEGMKAGGSGNDEWEVLQHDTEGTDEEVAIRVDQYLVVFLKVRIPPHTSKFIQANLKQFMASVTPGIEHDFTMGV